MARTIQEVYDGLILEKETQTELQGLVPSLGETASDLLSDLDSGSKVAIWRLLFWVHAVGIFVHENIFDLHVVEVEAIRDTLIAGVPLWYQQETLLYQHGDNLVWNNVTYVYDPIDETKRVIKRSAVTITSAGEIKIKVARLDGSGNPIPLTAGQLAGITAYWETRKFAGEATDIVSQLPDLLKVFYDVYYNPLVMAADGSLIDDPAVFPAEDAINGFIKDLPFNAVLNLTALTDAVQLGEGIVDPVLTLAEADNLTVGYVPIIVNYTASAGHLKVDPAFPLSTTLTYIEANV